MIKFIASDLDGTLLDGDRSLPNEIFPLIEALHGQGILFCPASGRQYDNLKKLFAPVCDKVLFVCENGALVKYREETLHLCPIDDGLVREALAQIRAIPHLYPVLCGTATAYLEDDVSPFRGLAMASYTSCRLVPSLESMIGTENICKIAVFDETSAEEHCIRILPQRLPRLRTILSGKEWCDVSSPEANKGEAVKIIQKLFGFRREECVAFGDHMNDYEMLLACGNAFVPENAYEPLKRMIGRTIPSNAEGGVQEKLKEILSGRSI